ncbi:MAG: hypothetical protein WCY19_08635 [Candidatus Gastranaerophilaceae bacterium]
MDVEQEYKIKKELIKYFKSVGIEVYTNTKARGHQGFFLKNRIDISKNTKEDRIIPTLLHEFAHFIHQKIEPEMVKTGGSLETLFNLDMSLRTSEASAAIQKSPLLGLLRRDKVPSSNDENHSPIHPFTLSALQKELLSVTHYVDENSLCHKFHEHKLQVKKNIKSLENLIKQDYPNFMRSKKFKDFDKYIKKSKAKYLLKYDRVKFVSPFLRTVEIFSIDNLERDFPDMPAAFCAYIRLRSAQKKQGRISARINKLNKYYSKPTELFARFIEGLYLDPEKTRQLAPLATQTFFELLESGYYRELKNAFQLISGLKIDTTDLSPKYLFAQD